MQLQKYARLNQNGYKQVAAALAMHHQLPASAGLIKQSAEEAELNHKYGQKCHFVISSFVAKSHKTIELTISEEGYDIV